MRRTRNLLITTLLCTIAVAMAGAQSVAGRPVTGDNQLYFFMTERCASGTPPHLSQMEVKTQLSTLIGGAVLAAGRLAGADDIAAGRAASVTAAALVAVFAWLLAAELTASASAALVAGAATFMLHGVFVEAAIGFQPKLFMAVFLLAAHLYCAQRRPFGSGVAAMCAFLCWQPSAVVLAGCGLATLLDRRGSWRAAARLAAGALLALLAYEAWFALNGAIAEQLHQEWVLAFGAHHDPIDWQESLWFLLTEARGSHAGPHATPTLFAATAALLWLAMLARPSRTLAALRERPGAVAFWISAHLAVAFTVYDHQAHPDLLLVQPYFVVACGIAFGWLAALLRRVPAGGFVTALAAALLVAFALGEARRDVMHRNNAERGLDAQLAQGRLVDLYHDHRGSVWILGPVHLLALNHLDNWVPVGNVGHETHELDMKAYRPLRDGKMPEVILAGRGLRPGMAGWLVAEYVDVTPQPLAKDRIRVFIRRLGPGSGFDIGSSPKPARGPLPARRPPRPPANNSGTVLGNRGQALNRSTPDPGLSPIMSPISR